MSQPPNGIQLMLACCHVMGPIYGASMSTGTAVIAQRSACHQDSPYSQCLAVMTVETCGNRWHDGFNLRLSACVTVGRACGSCCIFRCSSHQVHQAVKCCCTEIKEARGSFLLLQRAVRMHITQCHIRPMRYKNELRKPSSCLAAWNPCEIEVFCGFARMCGRQEHDCYDLDSLQVFMLAGASVS